jgi:hypothetical protein
MFGQSRVAVTAAAVTISGLLAGCSSPTRPRLQDASSVPTTCRAAVEAAFPGGKQGTLLAYRQVARRCASLEELSQLRAFDGSILRLDCAPADVLALGAEIPQPGTAVPAPPPDLLATPVCRQFNRECADYDELRRDHAAVTQNPTLANRGLYVHHRALFDSCRQKYG